MINLHRFNRLGFTLLTLLFAFFVVAASSCSGESTDNETPADDEVEEEEEEINPYIEYDGLNGTAVNPIINQVFTADPSAKVFNDRIYVYTSHDLEDQTNYQMTDYHVFSSDDMVNWQDHGPIFSKSDTTWVTYLFAPDCAYSETTGKYYLYFPDSGDGIGVAVSDSPAGPFEDALDEPLVSRSTPGVEDVDWVFDPMCFIDDDGQAYLYFGGGMPSDKDNCRVIRLNDDMISLKDASATKIVAPNFFEAAFMNKRDGVYYLSYSTTFDTTSGEIDYMTSDDPMTGFEHKGTVLPNPPYNNGNNNHHSILEFGDNWYVFYHNRRIANREGYSVYQRSVTVDYLYFDENGDIITVEPTTGNVKQLKDVDAFSLIEAEMMADQR
ncbi:MAG: family 43 glycosylhydrolase, partial [Spirochaetota bacterium]